MLFLDLTELLRGGLPHSSGGPSVKEKDETIESDYVY